MARPIVCSECDYGGYFDHLVETLIAEKEGAFTHRGIRITAGPYKPYAVSHSSKDGILTLDFYSPLRVGFGHISGKDRRALVALL